MSGFKHLKGRCNQQEHRWLQEGPGKLKVGLTDVCKMESGHCYCKVVYELLTQSCDFCVIIASVRVV